MKEMNSESRFTFLEATSIIVGHGVGSGVLAVPFLASRNRWYDFLWIVAAAYVINLILHFMIAELSYNNDGAQFIKCFEKELFTGKLKKLATWIAFGFLGFSVIVNVSGFISGAAAVFFSWFGLPSFAGMLLYYVLAAAVVYVGMKLVGICEKIAVCSMVGVIGILFAATLLSEMSPLPAAFISFNNVFALYGMIAFSLSAVMSVPQVVKGLNGDRKKVRASIAAGTGINVVHDSSGRRKEYFGKRRAGGFIPAFGRLGQHYWLSLFPAGAVYFFLGQHLKLARHYSGADRMGP